MAILIYGQRESNFTVERGRFLPCGINDSLAPVFLIDNTCACSKHHRNELELYFVARIVCCPWRPDMQSLASSLADNRGQPVSRVGAAAFCFLDCDLLPDITLLTYHCVCP